MVTSTVVRTGDWRCGLPGGQRGQTRDKREVLPDVVCLSHLRWNFVYQRPQHLMVRWARERRVFFIEEPVFDPTLPDAPDADPGCAGHLVLRPQSKDASSRLLVATPYLPARFARLCPASVHHRPAQAARVADGRLQDRGLPALVLHADGAAASRATSARRVVYDCMDELSAFRARRPRCSRASASSSGAPTWSSPAGRACTRPSGTGTRNVHAFPSSVDAAHFAPARARRRRSRPTRRRSRARASASSAWSTSAWTSTLLAALAEARPDWQLVWSARW